VQLVEYRWQHLPIELVPLQTLKLFEPAVVSAVCAVHSLTSMHAAWLASLVSPKGQSAHALPKPVDTFAPTQAAHPVLWPFGSLPATHAVHVVCPILKCLKSQSLVSSLGVYAQLELA
jgi:hypothetical protein